MSETIQKVRYEEIETDEFGHHTVNIGGKSIPIPPGSSRSMEEGIISMPDWWVAGNEVEAFVEE